ncbi:MAG: GDSL-like Lipase/Acylhydrolase, partial [Phycisphaerales bacterium]|nr:GDSL-like Lipase/Acylhydrolase [Phycisphaerales bacterium]
MKRTLAAAAFSAVGAMFVLAGGTPARAAEGGLKAGDYVAVIGDSITEQKQYSVFIEDYLLMCKPVGGITVTQFGWGGETAPGFAGRMANDMIPFGASAATTNFGMNDGGYSPMDPGKAKRYHDGQTSVVGQLKKAGVRFIVVGSPGCVDSDTFRHDPSAAAMYNKTLSAERDIAKQVAQEQGVAFADVIDPMLDVMQKAKAKYGKEYHVGGGDGVHPDANGHLVMAYAYLKG